MKKFAAYAITFLFVVMLGFGFYATSGEEEIAGFKKLIGIQTDVGFQEEAP